MTSATRLVTCLFVLLSTVAFMAVARTASAADEAILAEPAFSGVAIVGQNWTWPLSGPRVVTAPYRAPAHDYGAGHRGVDLAADPGTMISAPAAGIVAFRGTVVDRPLITIAHPGGLVSTLEPVASELAPGDSVVAGQPVGVVNTGGHTPPGAVHIGVRLDGDYINPMLLFGPVPRAVLLPCCATQ